MDRYTPHSYAGYWWICDNQTGEAVMDISGRHRLFYRIETLGMQVARDRAFNKAARLNAEGSGK